MNTSTQDTRDEASNKHQGLYRYIYRIGIPSVLAGVLAILALQFFNAREVNYQEEKPEGYQAAIAERGAYFFQQNDELKTNTSATTDPSSAASDTNSALVNFEQQIEAFEDKIEALESATPSNWEDRSEEVLSSWEKLQETYDNLNLESKSS